MTAVEEAVITDAEAILLTGLAATGLIIVLYVLRTGVPPIPTSAGTRAAILRLLPAELRGTVYDLGSGWGGLARLLATRYPGNQVVGIELSPAPWLFARALARLLTRPNLRYRRADLLDEPLEDAGAVVFYLMPGMLRRLAPKLAAELRPGTVVISYCFALDGWEPDSVIVDAESGPSPIYRYVAPGPGVTPAPSASSPAGTGRSPGMPR